MKQEGDLKNDKDSFHKEMKRLRQEHTEILEALKNTALKQLIQAEQLELEQHHQAPCWAFNKLIVPQRPCFYGRSGY